MESFHHYTKIDKLNSILLINVKRVMIETTNKKKEALYAIKIMLFWGNKQEVRSVVVMYWIIWWKRPWKKI